MHKTFLLLLLFPTIAQAESLRFTTNARGENAIRMGGQTYSWTDLKARQELNPVRFNHYHERLGSLLNNTEKLCARMELNPERFAQYHPFLAYLLKDYCKDVAEIPPIVPPTNPCPPIYPPDTPVSPPNVVPEPPSILLWLFTTVFLGYAIWRKK